MRATLRAWYFRALTYLDQFKEEAPACCGACRACATATAGAVTGLVITTIRRGSFGATWPRTLELTAHAHEHAPDSLNGVAASATTPHRVTKC